MQCTPPTQSMHSIITDFFALRSTYLGHRWGRLFSPDDIYLFSLPPPHASHEWRLTDWEPGRVFWATHCTADIASRSPPRLRAARSRSQRAERWERSPLLGKFSCDCCNCFREQLGISRISHLVLNTLCSFFKIQFTFTLFLLICHQYKFMIYECASLWQFLFKRKNIKKSCLSWVS